MLRLLWYIPLLMLASVRGFASPSEEKDTRYSRYSYTNEYVGYVRGLTGWNFSTAIKWVESNLDRFWELRGQNKTTHESWDDILAQDGVDLLETPRS